MRDGRPPAPTAPDVSEFPDLVEAGLPDLCARYRELLDEESRIRREKEELMLLIRPLAEVNSIAVAGESWVLTYAKGSVTSKISAEMLLVKGVGIDVIEACTVRTERAGYWQVRAKTDSQ